MSPAPAPPRSAAAWLVLFCLPGIACAAVATAILLTGSPGSRVRQLAFAAGWGAALALTLPLLAGRARAALLRARWGLVVAAVTFALSLGAAEGALQLLLHPAPIWFEGNIFRGDAELGWDLVPGSSCRHWRPGLFDARYGVSPQGTRGAAWSLEGDGATSRPLILAVGCSQTFGWGVGDAEPWPARLEAALAADGEGRFARALVVNRAIIADGPAQMALRAEAFARDVARPDLVLVALQEIHLDRLGADARWNEILRAKGVRVPMLAIDPASGTTRVVAHAPEIVAEVAPAEVNMLNAGEYDREVQLLRFALAAVATLRRAAGPPAAQATDATWELLRAAVRRVGEVARAAGAPAAIVVLPRKPQHDVRHRAEFLARLREYGAEAGVAVWDIEADAEVAAGGASLFFHRVNEYHLCPAGQQGVGQAVAARVRALGAGQQDAAAAVRSPE